MYWCNWFVSILFIILSQNTRLLLLGKVQYKNNNISYTVIQKRRQTTMATTITASFEGNDHETGKNHNIMHYLYFNLIILSLILFFCCLLFFWSVIQSGRKWRQRSKGTIIRQQSKERITTAITTTEQQHLKGKFEGEEEV